MGNRRMDRPSRETLLREYEGGMSTAQLAARYEMPRGTVKWSLAAARADRVGRGGPGDMTAQEVGPRAVFEARGNFAEATSGDGRIRTLEALLEACQVDLTVWAVERYVVNKWEVGRAAADVNLTWDEGVMSGHKRDVGAVSVEPLWQVKAWLARKAPVAMKPVVSPVVVGDGFRPGKAEKREGLRCALVLPDAQFGFRRRKEGLDPFHDRRALGVVMGLAAEIKPDVTVWLGDVLDNAMWSDKFVRTPDFYFTTQAALVEAAWVIAQTRKATRGEVYVLEGNHDKRPETAMAAHLVEAYGLRAADQLGAAPALSVDNLLGLSRMGVAYVEGYPDGEVWLTDEIKLIHGSTVRAQSGVTSKAVANEEAQTTIFGHIHRMEMAMKTVRGRNGYRTLTMFSPGCLCRVDGAVPGSTLGSQWQQGAAVVWYEAGGGLCQIVPVPIYEGQAVYNGRVLVGEDYLERLKEATGYEF